MKNIIVITLVLVSCIVFNSCSTSQKLTIYGQPGTDIYSPNMTKLATIDNGGKAEFKLSRDEYYAYMLSYDANSKEMIPFALDYKNKSYIGARVLQGVEATVAGVGLFAEFVGLLMVAGGDDDIATPWFCGGSGAALVGCFSGMATSARLDEKQRDYQFKYLSNQKTNQDFQFTHFVDNGYKKSIGVVKTASVTAQNTHGAENAMVQSESMAAKSLSSKSKKTLNDYGKQLEGTYSGTGKLLMKDDVVENYQNIKVVLTRVDKNNVKVEVFENNGDAFFSSASRYSISKTANGKYVLSLSGIPSATITIEKDNDLVYFHPKVNIDGDIYTLEIYAKK